MNIRSASPADATQIHGLLFELGHSPSIETFLQQFAVYRTSESARVLVAAEQNSELRGVLSASVIPLFHQAGFLGRITALVVSSEYRGKGVGSSLLAAAEDWFRSLGCARAEVVSGDERLDAHRFYQAREFARASQRFIKRYDS